MKNTDNLTEKEYYELQDEMIVADLIDKMLSLSPIQIIDGLKTKIEEMSETIKELEKELKDVDNTVET